MQSVALCHGKNGNTFPRLCSRFSVPAQSCILNPTQAMASIKGLGHEEPCEMYWAVTHALKQNKVSLNSQSLDCKPTSYGQNNSSVLSLTICIPFYVAQKPKLDFFQHDVSCHFPHRNERTRCGQFISLKREMRILHKNSSLTFYEIHIHKISITMLIIIMKQL